MVEDFSRRLHAEAEVLDREHITNWLMRIAANQPLEFHHAQMGDIRISGVRFSGSTVSVFDRYVSLSINDLVVRHVQLAEEALDNSSIADLQYAARQMAGLILATQTRLFAKAREVKGTLLRANPTGPSPLRGASPPSPQIDALVEAPNVAARLKRRATDVAMHRIEMTAGRPVFQKLERFAQANPALLRLVLIVLTAIASFVAGLAVARIH